MASTETAPSPQSEIQRELFRTFGDRLTADPPLELDQIREMFEGFHALAAEPTEVCYEEVDAGGIPSLWCLPIGAAADRVMLFFHGGGFVTNTASSHRKMAGHLAKAAGVRGLVIDYRRAPEHSYPAQLEDAVVAYRWLLDQGIAAEHIFTCGDSAGGNLATSLPLKLRDEGLPLPGADRGHLALVRHGGQGRDVEDQRRDRHAGAARSRRGDGGHVPRRIGIADGPAGQPTARRHGTECRRSSSRPGAGRRSRTTPTAWRSEPRRPESTPPLEIVHGMQHVFTFQAGLCPEADQTIATIGRWVRPKLGLG